MGVLRGDDVSVDAEARAREEIPEGRELVVGGERWGRVVLSELGGRAGGDGVGGG